jgi:hypothetical protein
MAILNPKEGDVVLEEPRLGLWSSRPQSPSLESCTPQDQCKNHIHFLEHNGETLVTKDHKADATYSFFDDILGTPPTRSNAINLELPDHPYLNLSNLGNHFTEEEVWNVIISLPSDKAPRSDSFMT